MSLAQLSEMELVCLSLHEDGSAYVVDHLIWGNPSLKSGVPHSPADFALMNNSQRALASLAEFEGEVLNGGVSQYLFNCSNQLGALLESLPTIEWPEFETEVRRAFASLDVETINDLAHTRDIWDRDDEFEDRWTAFREWADTFDGEAFDAWFYHHQDEYTRRLMQLVWRRRTELITCT